jgi:ABC transport system ATP-binding/permease protein
VRQRAHVGELSGGERRRLELLRVLGQAPNLLLLDEPTNDLDLDTLGVLEGELDTWSGTVVVASHDRFFLDRVCKDLYALEPGGAMRHQPGGWSGYRARERERADEAARAGRTTRGAAAPGRRTRRPRKRAYHEDRELAHLEQRIPELEARKAQLVDALQAAGDDYGRAAAVGEELAAVTAELDAAETRWIELAAIGEEAI